MKHCHFCQTSSSIVNNNMGLPRIKCLYCSEYELDVYTYFVEKQPIYADIYFPHKDKEFCFTLFLKENCTSMSLIGEYKNTIYLPGFPVNPLNAKQKFKLYMLFS